jgi:hypothetical protein
MATVGTYLKSGSQKQLWNKILLKLGLHPYPGNPIKGGDAEKQGIGAISELQTGARKICAFYIENVNLAAKTTDADYAPSGLGDLCWDSTNNDVYRCTTWASTTSYAWTKIAD